MEKERLRLFNQYVRIFFKFFFFFFLFLLLSFSLLESAHCRRMLGKELDGMSYSELFVFSFEISGAIMKVVSMKKIKRDEEMGKTKRPRPSVNKVYPLCFFLNCKTVSLLLSLTISFSCSQRSQSPRDRYDGGGRFSSLVTTLRDWI